MSEKNNKIKIGELLTQIKVTNLKKYFNTLNSEVSIKDLFKGLSKKIRADEYLYYTIEDVFTLVSHIWKSYQNSKDSFNLGNDEIHCMFDTLCDALTCDNREEKSNVPKALAMFQLIKDVWDARRTTEDGDLKLSASTIRNILATLVYAIEKGDSTGLNAQEVFTFIKDVWDIREKAEDDDLKLSQFAIQLMFEAVGNAIQKGDSTGLTAQEVFQLIKDVWDARKRQKMAEKAEKDEDEEDEEDKEDEEDDLKLSHRSNHEEAYAIFGALYHALTMYNQTEKLEAQEVLKLIKDVWDVRSKTEDDNFKLQSSEIDLMFEALDIAMIYGNAKELNVQEVFTLIKNIWDVLSKTENDNVKLSLRIDGMFISLNYAIEKGNSTGLNAQEVFNLVDEFFSQGYEHLMIRTSTAEAMLNALFLTYDINEQPEQLKLLLQNLDLDIVGGRICMVDKDKASDCINKIYVIQILEMIKGQNTEEKKNQVNNDNNKNSERENKNKKEEKEEEITTFNISQFNNLDAFYKEIKDQTNNKTEAMDNLLNDNKALSNVPTNVWDIIKTFFWRLFCCMENPFHNLYNYTKLRVGFNQLKIQQQIGQDLSDSKLECEWFTTLRSHLLSKQENSKVSELKNGKNDLINK